MIQKLHQASSILACSEFSSLPTKCIEGKVVPSDEQKDLYRIAERIIREVLDELVMLQNLLSLNHCPINA